MNPVPLSPMDCTQFVPSLVVPTQTIMVQHLFQPRRPLSPQDLYVLQRTAIPAGQLWSYTLHSPDHPLEVVQLTLLTTPTLSPADCLASPACVPPPDLNGQVAAMAEFAQGYEADTEAEKSDMTEAIYGP